MSPREKTRPRSGCPVNVALEYLGDRWSLLIVRDLMFFGRKSFKDFLKAEEKIATNVLSERLSRLESHGIVARQRDPVDARRAHYTLTRKGADLAPTLVELILWSARYEKTAATPRQIRELTEDRGRILAEITRRWRDAESSRGA